MFKLTKLPENILNMHAIADQAKYDFEQAAIQYMRDTYNIDKDYLVIFEDEKDGYRDATHVRGFVIDSKWPFIDVPRSRGSIFGIHIDNQRLSPDQIIAAYKREDIPPIFYDAVHSRITKDEVFAWINGIKKFVPTETQEG